MSFSSMSPSYLEVTPSSYVGVIPSILTLTGSTLQPTVTSVTVSIASSPTTTSARSLMLTTSVSVKERNLERRKHKPKPKRPQSTNKPFRELWNERERAEFDGLNKDLSEAVARTDRKQAADVLKQFSERNKVLEGAKDGHEVTGMAKGCIANATTIAKGIDPSWEEHCECVLSIKGTYDQFVGQESAAGKSDVLGGWRKYLIATGILYVASNAC